MSSLLQRAGRCARFGGFGEVKVYREILINKNSQLVEADLATDLDTEKEYTESTGKRRQFLPYQDDICNLTWDVLKKHDVSKPVGFQIEASMDQ